MNRRTLRNTTIALTVALLPALAPAATDAPPAATPQAVVTNPATVEAKLADLSAEIERLKVALAQALKENQRLKTELDRHHADTTDLQVENKRLEELAGLTAKGEVVASAAALIKSRYDTAADTTTVNSTPQKVAATGSMVQSDTFMSLEYSYRGQQMTAPPESATLVLQTFSRPNTRYGSTKQLGLTIDGEKMDAALIGYELVDTHRTLSPQGGMTRYDEALRFKLDDATLQKLARATSAKAELAGNELPISRDMLATAKAVRERIRLGR